MRLRAELSRYLYYFDFCVHCIYLSMLTSFYWTVPYDVLIVGVVCGVVTASVVVALIWMYCNRKRKRQSSYEQILPDSKQNMHIENGTLVVK